jgi:hypothetical protein
LVFVSFLGLGGACATGTTSDPPGQATLPADPAPDAAPAPDARTTPGDAAAPDASRDARLDAPIDAPPDAGCGPARPATNDRFAPVDPHWATAGAADINTSSNGWSKLTDVATGQTGALWWNASYTFDHFEVTASFIITQTTSGADGLTFAWVPGADVTQVGGAGGAFGLVGLGGYGVAVDTYQNPGEPPVPYLAVLDGTTGAHLARASLPEVRDWVDHQLRVELAQGKVSAWVDGTQYLQQIALPGYAPFAGHWGFTASTGGLAEAHYVQNITMVFPDGQGCVK